MEQFEAWVHDTNPDIIGVTESWSTSAVLDSELALGGYDLFRKDRPVDREGGGVLLYVKNELHAIQHMPAADFPEQVWSYFLDTNNVKCYIGVCYRTPTADIYSSQNHDLLQDVIRELGSTKKHFMLMGDCNYRFLSWPPYEDNNDISRAAGEFCECLDDNFFTQHVTIPTRNDAILDLVITDEPDMIYDLIDLGPFPGSDHNALSWKLQVKTTHDFVHKKFFDYRKADLGAIKRELQAVDWQKVFYNQSVEQSWLILKEKISNLEQKYVPIRQQSGKRSKPIWMTHKALKAVKQRRRIYRKYKDIKHPAYVKAAKTANTLIKQARKKFEDCLAKKIKDDRKSFFAYVRRKSKSNVKVGSLSTGQGLVSDAKQKAQVLNDFFGSVFTKEDITDIPVPDSCFDGGCEAKLVDIVIDPETVAAKLRNLKSDKAAGDDNLSSRLLRNISSEIASPIATIFRKSLDTGCIPRDWRTANVTPLFKKGNRSQAENYRPISLTSQICKVVESILRDELVQHLESNKLLHNSQHGFRSGYSCATNLLTFLETLTACIDNKVNIDTVYLDLAKAFDKVPHQRLLLKLKAHGVDGLVCNWIKAWLADRQQRVCLDGSYSSWRPVWSGVPQGSVLGPVLFLIFINDLDTGLSSKILKFADDTKIFRPVMNHTDGLGLQQDLDSISNWARRWQMEFNVSKCKVMHFGKGNIRFRYIMDKQALEEVDCEKDLGVNVCQDLKVSVHCREAYSKANRMLGLISRTIKYRNPKSLVSLYKSLVRPQLDYCSTVWHPHFSKDKSLLEKVQHRFTRLFPHLRGLPYEERLHQLGLWSLEERWNRADLLEIFKMVKGFTATPWSVFFHRAEDKITRGHSWKLTKNHCHCNTRLQFFSQRVINRWNSLTEEDISVSSVNCFKNRLEKRRNRQMDFFKDG